MDIQKLRELSKDGKTFKTTIPSTKKEVYGKAYTLDDEIKLTTLYEQKDMKLFFASLLNLIADKFSLNAEEMDNLTMIDLQWLMCQIKKNSDGKDVKFSIQCPKCKTNLKSEIDIDDIHVIRSENFSKIIDVNENVKMEVRIPKCIDFFEIFGDLIKSEDNEEVDENDVLVSKKTIELFKASIKSFYVGNNVEYVTDEDRKSDEFDKMILEDYRKQFMTFMYWFEKDSPALVYDKKLKCANCNEEFSIAVNDFFYSVL